jgi:hypothetical protein
MEGKVLNKQRKKSDLADEVVQVVPNERGT